VGALGLEHARSNGHPNEFEAQRPKPVSRKDSKAEEKEINERQYGSCCNFMIVIKVTECEMTEIGKLGIGKDGDLIYIRREACYRYTLAKSTPR
jgi:hypothetical protein